MTKGAGPGYEGLQRKKLLTLLITLALVLTAALVEAGTGSIKFGLDEIFLALTGRGSATANTVLFGIRFPRAVAAILVGAALAMSGAVMQCVLHNPLASASTLGVSQGAAFGAAVGIYMDSSNRPVSGNYSQYVNPEADELVALGNGTNNVEERKAYYKELIELYMKDVPSVALYVSINAIAHSDQLVMEDARLYQMSLVHWAE